MSVSQNVVQNIRRAPKPNRQAFDKIVIRASSHAERCDTDFVVIETTNRFTGREWRIGSKVTFHKGDSVVKTDEYGSGVAAMARDLNYNVGKVYKLQTPLFAVAQISFYYKNTIRASITATNMADAFLILPLEYQSFTFSDAALPQPADAFCDQEGCIEPWANTFKVKDDYCDVCRAWHGKSVLSGVPVLKFCQKHSVRGEEGPNDCDDNYELIDGPGKSVFNQTVPTTPAMTMIYSYTSPSAIPPEASEVDPKLTRNFHDIIVDTIKKRAIDSDDEE